MQKSMSYFSLEQEGGSGPLELVGASDAVADAAGPAEVLEIEGDTGSGAEFAPAASNVMESWETPESNDAAAAPTESGGDMDDDVAAMLAQWEAEAGGDAGGDEWSDDAGEDFSDEDFTSFGEEEDPEDSSSPRSAA